MRDLESNGRFFLELFHCRILRLKVSLRDYSRQTDGLNSAKNDRSTTKNEIASREFEVLYRDFYSF